MSDAASVAVVTVSFNSGDALRTFLGTIDAAGAHADVVVVDNASPDPGDLVEVVAAGGGRLIELPENLGYGGAVNAGIAATVSATSQNQAVPPAVNFVLVRTKSRQPRAT